MQRIMFETLEIYMYNAGYDDGFYKGMFVTALGCLVLLWLTNKH
jgi:hypothetical protein